jgi:hypothetical protein
MNDEQDILHDMLRRATAAGDDLPADLDAETAGLREGWLALGKLLDDAESAAGAPPESWKLLPRAAPRRWPVLIAAALAASLLIAVGATVASRLLNSANDRQAGPQSVAHENSANSSARQPEAQPQSPAPQVAANSDTLNWSDSLDDEIATVAQAAVSARYDTDLNLRGLSAVERDMDQLETEMNSGKL